MIACVLGFLALGIAPTQTYALGQFGQYDLLGGFAGGRFVTVDAVRAQWKANVDAKAWNLRNPKLTQRIHIGELAETPYATLGGDVKPEFSEASGIWLIAPQSTKPFPRPLKPLPASNKTYAAAFAKAIAARGINKPSTRLSQIWKGDLNGDKSDEVVLVGQSRTNVIEQRPGDFSGVLVRHVVKGKVQTSTLVLNDYRTGVRRTPLEDAVGANLEVFGAADLDGDGKMEIFVEAQMYEAFEITVFSFDGRRFRKVLSMGGGV